MSKFDGVDKKGNPITMETETHGPVRKTLGKLEELGYIKNYNESLIGTSRIIIEKLAFANGDIKEKVDIYNIRFQKTGKEVDFEDETLRKAFPAVFSKRGIIAKQGYRITRDENGALQIEHPKRKDRKRMQQSKTSKELTIRDRVKADISEEDQKKFVEDFIERQHGTTEKARENDFTK